LKCHIGGQKSAQKAAIVATTEIPHSNCENVLSTQKIKLEIFRLCWCQKTFSIQLGAIKIICVILGCQQRVTFHFIVIIILIFMHLEVESHAFKWHIISC